MHCDGTNVTQALIRIDNGYVYKCTEDANIEISCPEDLKNNINENQFDNSTIINYLERSSAVTLCGMKIMRCEDEDEKIYCRDNSLYSKSNIFCNSTTLLNGIKSNDESIVVLNCYEGKLPVVQASFIPTIKKSTDEDSLSYSAKVHIFFLELIGNFKNLAKIEDEAQEVRVKEGQWVPEALTMAPETTTTSSYW